MSQKPKGGLGRGLDSLITVSSSISTIEDGDRLTNVPVAAIRTGRYQARVQINDESLNELAESIKAQGVIQPIIVREYGLDGYELIAGERRWRAAQLAGLTEIPVVIKQINDKTAMAMGLIENIQRENLNPIELANSYKELIDEYKITQEGLANIIHKSRTQITNTMRLLLLSPATQKLLQEDKLTQGHAKIIVGLGPKDERTVVDTIIGQKLSVRETENLVKKIKEKTTPKKEILRVNKEYSDKLLEVQKAVENFKIKSKVKAKSLVLEFESTEQMQNFIDKLG